MEQNIELDQEPVIIQQGGGAVNSVNGQTGDVVLTTSDLENTSDYQTGSEVQNAIDEAVSQIDIPTNVSELTNDADYQNAQQVASAVAGEATLREAADTNLQGQIDAISASSDVTDIVGTYAELQAYDTSTLGDNDIIKVLQDESRNDETTYYRWSTTTQTFTLIGEEGPYYTKGQADGRFVAQTTYTTDKAALEAAIGAKQDELTAGNNVQISGNVISATDTTYSDFTGTDGQTAGAAGLVPAPAATDADKFLKSDGTWDTAGGGSSVNVVQTTGTSTTDVMSQDATTKMIWPNVASKPGVFVIGSGIAPTISSSTTYAIGIGSDTFYQRGVGNNAVSIGRRTTAGGVDDIAIGEYADAGSSSGYNNVAIGDSSQTGQQAQYCVVLGSNASTQAGPAKYSVALGAYAKATRSGEVNIGVPGRTNGYNSTAYRVLGGVHAAVDDHDAVNLEQMNSRIVGSGTAAPTTSTVGSVGALYAYVESGTGHLAICTAADASTSTYTWQTLV